MVYQEISSPPKDESREKLVDPDPNLDADLEEVELVGEYILLEL